MALVNYTDLKAQVANWLRRDDLTTFIPDMIRLGELRIWRDLRTRGMEATLSSAIASGVLALPTDYIELKFAYVNLNPVRWLERKPADFIYKNYSTRSSDGIPRFIAREAENFIFGPFPDSTYTIKGIYYKRLATLSDSILTNWLTLNAIDLLLMASLFESAPFLRDDPRLVVWEAKYKELLKDIQEENDTEEASGSPVGMSHDYSTGTFRTRRL